jgi:DNA repair protein RecO (recombination protein O)
MVVYYKEERDLHRLSEVKISHPFQSLPFEVAKSSMALFITEMLTKSLKEETGNPELFQFLTESVLFLEEARSDYENFHLAFLLKLTLFLGFGPENARAFENQLREHAYPFLPDDTTERGLNILIRQPYGTPAHLNRTQRNELLDALVAYYRIHIDTLGEIKSLPVLREVLG